MDFEVLPSPFEESFNSDPPAVQTERLAEGKVRALLSSRPGLGERYILGADTVIDLEGRVMGKPGSLQEADSFLSLLSGRTHRVVTTLALSCPARRGTGGLHGGVSCPARRGTDGLHGGVSCPANMGTGGLHGGVSCPANMGTGGLHGGEQPPIYLDTEITEITFAPLSHEERQWYLSTGEWKDAAGAYRIQGAGALFVEHVKGCYFNVVGLPLRLFYGMLQRYGYGPLQGINPAADTTSAV